MQADHFAHFHTFAVAVGAVTVNRLANERLVGKGGRGDKEQSDQQPHGAKDSTGFRLDQTLRTGQMR